MSINLLPTLTSEELKEAILKAVVREVVSTMPPRKDIALNMNFMSKAMSGQISETILSLTREAIQEVVSSTEFQEAYKAQVKNVLMSKFVGTMAATELSGAIALAAKTHSKNNEGVLSDDLLNVLFTKRCN